MRVIIGSGLITIGFGLLVIIMCYRDLARADSRLSFLKSPTTSQTEWERGSRVVTRVWPGVMLFWLVGVLVLVT